MDGGHMEITCTNVPVKCEFVHFSIREENAQKYLKTVRTESASKDGTYYPQIIILMESNYSRDAVPGWGRAGGRALG